MKLTEKEFNYILVESTKRILNEISWGTAEDAVKKSDNRLDMLEYAWDDFQNATTDMIRALQGIDPSGYADDDIQPSSTQGSKLAAKLEMLYNEINDFFHRKRRQKETLQNREKEKFNSSFGGRTFDEVGADNDRVFDNWLNREDDEKYVDWDTYKKQHMTPDEIDFKERHP